MHEHEPFCGCHRCAEYWLAVGRGERPEPVTGWADTDDRTWAYA